MQGGDGAAMTREEASRRYQIPMEILEEYEGWAPAARSGRRWTPGSTAIRTWSA